MNALANAFALLADEQGKEASSIVALKTAEVHKIAEKKKKISQEKKRAEANKKKKEKKKLISCVSNGGKEGHGHAQEILDANYVVDSEPISPLKANQEHKAINQNQGKAALVLSAEEEVRLAREKERTEQQWLAWEAERKERLLAREAELAREKERKEEEERYWLAREAERKEQLLAREAQLAREKERKEEEAQRDWLAKEAERKQRLLARKAELARQAEREKLRLAKEEERKERKKEIQERRKKEMAMKTLQEYEEQKAKVALSNVSLRDEATTLDNVFTKQDETVKKDSNIKKNWKVRKTMNIEEFLKLPTGREGQEDGQGRGNQNYAEDRTVKAAPDLSETSFPALGKVRKEDTC